MFSFEIGFDQPWYLLLLGLLPLLWIFSYRSLSGLGNTRRFLAIALRTIVFALLVLALAEVQWLRTSEKVTVIYLLDQSESIPLEKRQSMLDFVIESVRTHRDAGRADRAGVIVFGRNATIEIPPFDDDIVVLGGMRTYVDLRTDATNLEAALKLAQASFTEDSAKRIVVVTDGVENLGDARTLAARLADDGIGIDVVPVVLARRAEVAVERVTLPADIRRGQPIETRVVVNNFAQTPVRGKLTFTRRSGQREELLAEEEVELPPGKKVYSFANQIDDPGAYTYQADFTPATAEGDQLRQNNRATAFTHVRGKGSVLLIENWEKRGEFDFLVDRLRANDIELVVQSSDQLFSSLAELQDYDAIILANVPRSTGDDAQSVASFSDQQIEMLVRNTEQLGCGLIMLGGPDSFGVGGWSNTELEKAMPVDFQIKNAKIQAVGAIGMIMHASESADGNYWQKEVARKAIQALGPMDYCGLLHWDVQGDAWLWGEPNGIIRVGERRNMMLARLGRMTPGDMPEFDPAMKKAIAAFNRVNASVKLLIIISDGDPSPPGLSTLLRYKTDGVQVTTVAVGAHGQVGHQTLREIADYTGGRYYVVKDARALPKIYVSEVRRVARPLIFEPVVPVQPVVTYPHEILQGINGPLPPTSGFVLTTVKENPLVEVAAISPQPADPVNSTILASWTYGLGRTAVLTTDAGNRWAAAWTQWENYDKFFSQLVRWAMRPVGDTGKFSVATDVQEGKVRVVITALDKEDQFLNFLNMSATATDPQLGSFDVDIQQVAPGRYVGEFPASQEGNYFLNIRPGPNEAPIRTGVNVPYSAEFRQNETNLALLESLAQLRPKDGEPGMIYESETEAVSSEAQATFNPFRKGLPPAISSQDVWPLVLVCSACLFFLDVLVRRVTLGLGWVLPALNWLRTKLFGVRASTEDPNRLERLRQRKAAVAEQIDEKRAATRFEPVIPAEGAKEASLRSEFLQPETESRKTKKPTTQLAPDTAPAESYTSRLLKAKQQARQEIEKKERDET